MPNNRQQRLIHRELLRNNVIPFERWKYEGKDLSYFHKNIIDYDYKTRLHIFMSSGRYRETFPIKVKHKGWPAKSPMTPQAWTAMELLAGIQHMIYNHTSIPQELYEALYFISTCILSNEIETLWGELLDTVYICSDTNAKIWVALFHSIMTGIQNGYPECSITKPNNEYIKEHMRMFLDRTRKIDLLREYYYNRKEAFDTFIRWLYRGGPTPSILKEFFSLEMTFLEHRYSLTPSRPLLSLGHEVYPCHPQSPS